MILVSESIYSSRRTQWYTYENTNITQSQSHTNMCHLGLEGLKSDL